MTTYTKPAVRNAWGQTATSADLQDPGNSYASAGWQIGVKPPRQYFNWVLNYTFEGIRYLCQRGIPDWDSAETYSVGATVLSPAGFLYKCAQANNGQNPDSTTLGQFWDVPNVATPAVSDNTGRAASTGWVRLYALPVGSAFTAINGQIQNAQVPVGAVTQWQGSLSISGSQITSAVAEANTLFINGGYRSISWSGQGGQPSWLIGSNDGINFLVWNPSNFSVANANTVANLSPNAAAVGNSIVARDANGYVFAQYFNQASSNGENPSISQIMVTNGSDNFLRKSTLANLANALIQQNGFLTTGNFVGSAAVNGYQKFENGIIIQWGQTSVSGTATTFFPIAFPSRVASVVFTNASNTNQIFLNGLPSSNTSFSVTNGTANLSWLAVGF